SPVLMQHVVLPANWCANDSLPAWIDAESKRKMCEAHDDTKQMMEKNSKKISEGNSVGGQNSVGSQR
ncbi:MAG TPA: hypothetical protein VFJ43_05500, partial [Bacteroidia bacterium]|nr:hypothetical protein [Bacteroidia bacterium]